MTRACRGIGGGVVLLLVVAAGPPAAEAGVLAPRRPAPVPMTVQGVSAKGSSHVVLLQTAGGHVVIPIWIGRREAQAIQRGLHGGSAPRPMTHDLLRSVIHELGARIHRVEVSGLRDNVFIGRLTLRDRRGKRRQIDARPSDLIALAVAAGLPVYVAPEVIDRVGVRTGRPGT